MPSTQQVVIHAGHPALILLVLLAAAAIMVIVAIASKKRRQALEQLAAGKGMRFSKHDLFNLPNKYGQTKLCGTGDAQKAKNLIFGDVEGGQIRFFDYRYSTGSGKNRTTHRFGACAVSTNLHFTPLVVRPENVLDKLAGWFGFEDVDLDQGEFNRKFHVGCKDKKYAYDVLSQRVMQFFLDRPGISMEMCWNFCLFYYSGTLSVDKVGPLIDAVSSFAGLLPNYFKTDRAMSAPVASPAPGEKDGKPKRAFDGIEPQPRRRRY